MVASDIRIEARIVLVHSLDGRVFVDEVAHVVVSPERPALSAILEHILLHTQHFWSEATHVLRLTRPVFPLSMAE